MIKKAQLLVGGIVLSLWVVVSPWILGFSDLNVALWNNIFIGVLIGLVFLWVLFSED